MKNLLIIFVLIFSNYSFGLNCSSVASGNWNSPATWSCGVVPSPGDTITISIGHTVTVSLNTNLNGSPVVIYIDGVLLFDSPGAKLRLECGSIISLSSTGEIRDSGNGTPSHSITICGNDVWQGTSGSLFGPVIITGVPLSIELIDFNVVADRDQLFFQWSTANETNNDYFTIESSIDNEDWSEIGFHEGAGNSNEMINYELILTNNFEDIYFRLRQTDFDGVSTVSKVISITNKISSNLNVFPNPIDSDFINIETNMANYNLKIVSLAGKVVYEIEDLNENFLRLNDLNFVSGVYIVELSNQIETLKTKIVIK